MVRLPLKIDRSNQSGFTLVELMVVVAIIAFILSIATPNFSKLQLKNNIEGETRKLLSDLNQARSAALFAKTPASVAFSTGSYVVTSNGSAAASSILHYPLKKSDNSDLSGTTISFDTNGLTANTLTLMVSPSGSGAVVDCIVVDQVLSNMGQMKSGSCVLDVQVR